MLLLAVFTVFKEKCPIFNVCFFWLLRIYHTFPNVLLKKQHFWLWWLFAMTMWLQIGKGIESSTLTVCFPKTMIFLSTGLSWSTDVCGTYSKATTSKGAGRPSAPSTLVIPGPSRGTEGRSAVWGWPQGAVGCCIKTGQRQLPLVQPVCSQGKHVIPPPAARWEGHSLGISHILVIWETVSYIHYLWFHERLDQETNVFFSY